MTGCVSDLRDRSEDVLEAIGRDGDGADGEGVQLIRDERNLRACEDNEIGT